MTQDEAITELLSLAITGAVKGQDIEDATKAVKQVLSLAATAGLLKEWHD